MIASDGQWGLALEVPDTAGFRLWNVELLNWGTFDGSIVSFPIEGRDAFVTGSVGAGKSTIVDALTTLFVPTQRIVYNKAAGAGKNERRLETYLKGVYSTAADDTGTRAKPVALRDTKHISAILAHFRDEQTDTDAVFVHVYYFTSSGSIEKVYAVSDRPVTLEALLAGGNSDPRTLLRLMRQRVDVLGSWRDYLLAVRRMLGLPHEQALDLWFQTVSMKQVENLTTFVRSHMLEPPDETRVKIEKLVGHYENLTASAAAIERAKDQLAVLDPLMVHFDDYEQHAGDGDDLTRVRDEVLAGYYQGIEIDLVDSETRTAQARLTTAQARKRSLDADIASATGRIDVLKITINESGGTALTEIERQITEAEGDLGARRDRRTLFVERCEAAGVRPADDLESFLTLRSLVQRKHDEAATEAESRKPDYEVIADLHRKREEHRRLQAQIESLSRHRTNLDVDLLALRLRIAEATGTGVDALPFVGELLRVRQDRKAWEPAVQRLLYGFGSTLLVPEALYPVVSEWVDATNLRGRLTYQAVPLESRPAGRPSEATLPTVLEIAPASSMAQWLGGEVMRRFRSIVLADTTADFRAADQAITKKGQVKRPGRVHEKDDRFALGDLRRYVLGWDNKDKLEVFRRDADELAGEIEVLDEALKRAEQDVGSAQRIVNATDALLREYADFTQVDVPGAEARLGGLTSDREALLSASSTLAGLQRTLGKEDEALGKLREKQEGAVGEIARFEARITDLTDRRSDLPEQAPAVTDADLVLLTGLHTDVQARLASVTLTTVDKVRTRAREDLQARIDAAVKRAQRAQESAVRAMGQFKERYRQDANEMDASMGSMPDFRSLHQRLTDDDLPKFEGDFRRQLSENTLREIAGFHQHLEERRLRIRERVDRINESLVRIQYTRDTYIRLELANNPDPDLAAFRRDLKQCIDGTLGGGDDVYTMDRFKQVKAIVERFKNRDTRAEEDRAWTARVTDVRNWCTFAIVERNRESSETVAYYSDSEGKSGGEKEKLAYTVLAAALSYQFGLVPGDPRPKTFRFIALDEAFARGSDTSTRFALELFKTMGLQLLIVTPLQKKEVIAPYVQRVALITLRSDSRSRSLFMRIEDYLARMDAVRAGEAAEAAIGSPA